TFIVYGFSTITLLIYNVVLLNPSFGYPADHWWIFLALAIFPTFFGHTLFNWALEWLSTSTISMGIVFEPMVARVLACVILGEQVTGSQWRGGTIVIVGLLLDVVSTSRNPKVTSGGKR